MKYQVVLADPPWSFKTWSPKGQGRAPKYSTMSLDKIAALPVAQIADDNCALFLWVLGWIPPRAIADVVDNWGFIYKTVAFDWWKVTQDDLPRAAKGYYTRASSERCILATRGTVPVLPRRRPIQAIIANPTKHSKKPIEAYEKIERMYPDAKKIELFARAEREGWDSIGEEIDSLDIVDALNLTATVQNKKDERLSE